MQHQGSVSSTDGPGREGTGRAPTNMRSFRGGGPSEEQVEAGGNNFLPAGEADDIVQVVYQSNNSGSLVGIESSLIPAAALSGAYDPSTQQYETNATTLEAQPGGPTEESSLHQPVVRVASTLPPVAEESSSCAASNNNHNIEEQLGEQHHFGAEQSPRPVLQAEDEQELPAKDGARPTQQDQGASCCLTQLGGDLLGLTDETGADDFHTNAIYSTVNKYARLPQASYDGQPEYGVAYNDGVDQAVGAYNIGDDEGESGQPSYLETQNVGVFGRDMSGQQQDDYNYDNGDGDERRQTDEEKKDIEKINAEICHIISRQKQGAAESGSLKNNFKKKLVLSASTNENDLIAHRQKLLHSQDTNNPEADFGEEHTSGSGQKFKRTHSVSFNVGSSRNSRHSVDIRNLPSYLMVKRASIVDVAKGAMSSLMHSFGSGGGAGTSSSSISNSRRDSAAMIDEEPIFEEPIAPTLSLGQRVALVKNDGSEFGTVGWIGQLPDVDDDWVVGVIFDNMIGNCDGAHNGTRYFYSRENYAMFVPLSVLTKTDNYIGRPETGTMLSRMSVSLKPGQLISIQRSSIRLQHCFLNAPHQRVGHDVRAVSNRLHCQCHNCGPCAHLTKQHSRVNALPAFGAHHAVNKKNSLAHAAVEILAHHHHHYHEEEHHEDEEHQFGDNAAHACNFVRYSCCQQNGGAGHEFSRDCELVRPELLDNLIHAPRAPHRRSARPKRIQKVGQTPAVCGPTAVPALEGSSKLAQIEDGRGDDGDHDDIDESQSCSSCSSSRSNSLGQAIEDGHYSHNTNSYQVDSMNYLQGSTIYNTLESRISLQNQQQFVYQQESRRDWDENDYGFEEPSAIGLIPRLRRCFGCLKQRRGGRRKRPKKRKLSARNRLIEYRRRQSTFVPSTLAKPQEDLASHGIVLPGWEPNGQENYNSDYSSYSKSSGSDSPNSSPHRRRYHAPQEQQFISIDHNVQVSGEPLKSSNHLEQLSYDDYTFDNDGGYRSHEKFAHSQESDLGYFDLMTTSSGGTLKDIVDHAIDREESLQQIALIDTISPVQTNSISNSCCDHIEISSPTISMIDQDGNELSERFEGLDIEREPKDSSNN